MQIWFWKTHMTYEAFQLLNREKLQLKSTKTLKERNCIYRTQMFKCLLFLDCDIIDQQICTCTSSTRGVTSGAANIYTSGAPEFTLIYIAVCVESFYFMFCYGFLIVFSLLFYLCCLFLYSLWILNRYMPSL